MDPLRFVKAEIRQLLLQRGALSIAQLPEEYLKCYRKPLTQALKKLDSQYTPESARSGKPSGRARKSTLGAFLREHLTDVVEVRQRPHGQHEIVAAGVGGSPALGDAPNGEAAGGATPSLLQLQQQQQMRARGCSSSSSCCSCSGDRTLRSMQLKRSSRSSSNSISGGVNSISCASRCTR